MATMQEDIEMIELDVIGAQKKLDFATQDLKIDGKNLEACCIQHASLLAYYDEIQVQLKYSLNKAKLMELKVKSEIYIYIKENSKRDYTDSAIKIVIDSNPEYIKAKELVLMVEEVYDRAVAIVESFRTRSFDLRNIISIRENELQDVIIRA